MPIKGIFPSVEHINTTEIYLKLIKYSKKYKGTGTKPFQNNKKYIFGSNIKYFLFLFVPGFKQYILPTVNIYCYRV